MVSLAIIGAGHLGSIHTKLWREQQGVQVVGIVDADAERAAACAKEFAVPHIASFEEALERAEALAIITPTATHYDLAKRALKAGKHCFIEKPVTTSHAEALHLHELATKHRCVVHVGHVERFNPALRALGKAQARMGAGTDWEMSIAPLFIEAHRLAQFKPRAIDVSVVLDLMIHDIDIALWLTRSTIVDIHANGVAILTDTPDIANARLQFANGCVANLTASRISQKPMRKMRVFQQSAYISIDFAANGVEVFRLVEQGVSAQEIASGVPAMMLGNIDAGTRQREILFEKPVVEASNALVREQRAFVEAIGLGDAAAVPTATTILEAAEALRVADEIALRIAQQMHSRSTLPDS
jgi:predicted dehydrogenase